MPTGITTKGIFAMHAAPQIANPFALLTDPEAIFRAIEASSVLESLNRRVCRPLDRNHRDGNGEGDGQDQATQADVINGDAGRFFV
jgi:hypothetical protein